MVLSGYFDTLECLPIELSVTEKSFFVVKLLHFLYFFEFAMTVVKFLKLLKLGELEGFMVWMMTMKAASKSSICVGNTCKP